jgi:uncharacterized 2Fe-2S/4Fe-4S cluster protein (DUF4445 family)
VKITFKPKNITIDTTPGESLLAIAAEAGIILDGSCGGKGTCGKCRVIIEGKEELACLIHPQKDTEVTIPTTDEEVTNKQSTLSKHPEDCTASHAHGQRDGSFVRGQRDGSFVRGPADSYGISYDIGTTSVVGSLWNLSTYEPLGSIAVSNPQGAHGADVITRIMFAAEAPENLEKLHKMIAGAISSIAQRLLKENEIPEEDVKSIVCCGNTTMCHLLAGRDPQTLAKAPYHPQYTGAIEGKAADFGLTACKDADYYIMPCIAGHVGSDISSDIIALRTRLKGKNALMIDIGTNGEIFTCSREGKAAVCSTAAGPAFEGATIARGMRAATGAIEIVEAPKDPQSGDIITKVIGDEAVAGICGSGIIDSVATLINLGLVGKTGRLAADTALAELPLSDKIKQRIGLAEDGKTRQFTLEGDVAITQKDIREVQLGKAAIAAGAKILMASIGLTEEDLDVIYIAGAFGSHIDKESAQTIGLIPSPKNAEIEFVGNTAATGAAMVLLSGEEKAEAERLPSEITHIELAEEPKFQEEYMAQMYF